MSAENPVPTCIGFIMDGNRRWAEQAGVPAVAGHEAGMRRFLDVLDWVEESGICHVVFYAFSTENWRRSEAEVEALMVVFADALNTSIPHKIRFIGERWRFSESLQEKMATVEAISESTVSQVTVWVALSYGGRAEIVAAAEILRLRGEMITESTLGRALWSTGMPDPDLIIRTGGDMRLSNFLPWQAVYSELMFTSTYWPAFTKAEFTRMLAEYGERKRRFGA